ncbi:MAG: histidine phosphatase family protein [Eubacteriales bacterium]|nr:histidine phosphatase family protein [Eubacteriales bacterium]
MRSIYFVRHAQPLFPTGERYCLGGETDWPLSEEGRKQCEILKAEFIPEIMEGANQGKSFEVWSSPLKRAIETAEYLCLKNQVPKINQNLKEMSAGEWEGLSFSEIRQKYPVQYKLRRNNQGMELIPGAETNEQGLNRFSNAISEILNKSNAENIIIVAHATVIQLYMCQLNNEPLDVSRKYKPNYAEVIRMDINA